MGDPSVPSDTLGESPAVELTGKIMVVAIIILFMVVVFALFLHFYAKWFLSRAGEGAAPQARRRRRFVFASGQDPASYDALHRGLDPCVLRSLPVLVFQPQEFKEDGLECAVCLSELVEGEKARLLPKCNHGFHLDCIDMWFQSNSTCPLCRNPVSVSVSVSSSEGGHNASPSNNESSSSEPTFPTNVLIWGDHNRVSSAVDASLELQEESTCQPYPCSSSSSSSEEGMISGDSDNNNNRRHGMLVIDIPSEITSSSSVSRFVEEDELKSPMTGRLRSLKRLLSRDSRLLNSPWSPRSADLEQPGGGGAHS